MWSSPVRLWQYSYRTALEIAGPHWPKTSERTQVNTSWRTTTAHEPLPLGLCRPTAQPPPLNLSLFSQIKLGKLVSDVPTHEFQQQIENEADIIAFMGPYSLRVAEELVPTYIESLGLKGKIRFDRESASKRSRPDCVIKYDDKPIISFDYKGPNCVRENELERCFVASVAEARTKVAKQGQTDMHGKGNPEQGDTLFRVPGITVETERLTQTAIKYSDEAETPIVIFYDLDTLTVMKPPPEMPPANDNLMEVRIWKELRKSTENDLVKTPDNHVSVLIRHIVDMVCKVEAKKRTR